MKNLVIMLGDIILGYNIFSKKNLSGQINFASFKIGDRSGL